MARLLILRHGKTERISSSGEDFDRRLTRRGVGNSIAVGRHISDDMDNPELVLVSPSERTRGTAEHVMKQLGDAPVIFDDRIYHADAETLLEVLADHAGGHATVLLIGHNPGLVILIHMLLDADSRSGDPYGHFPTCALAELGFDVPAVGDVRRGSGTLISLLRPRDLGPGA